MDITGRKSATLESEKIHSAIGFDNEARQKNAGKEKREINTKTFSSFRLTAPILPFAIFAEMKGTKFTERALVKTEGRNKRGITIPDITPKISVASFLENPYKTSIAGINIPDAEDNKVSAVFEELTGIAVFNNERKCFLLRVLLVPFVTFIYERIKIKRLNASPAKIPKVKIAEEMVISFPENSSIRDTTVKILKSCSAISVNAGILTYPSA